VATIIVAPTNAQEPPTQDRGDVDRGTDAPVRTLEQTQRPVTTETRAQAEEVSRDPVTGALRINIRGVGDNIANDDAAGSGPGQATASTAGVAGVAGGAPGIGSVGGAPGVGANDDSGQVVGQDAPFAGTLPEVVVTASPIEKDERITPRPNILDRFPSSTYQASVYLLTTQQYQEYERTGKKNVQGYNLLFQSGGAPNNQFGPQQPDAAGPGRYTEDGRNPFFPNDFYINDITIENRLFGKSTQAAHSVANMKFTVIEPAGISLIDNIYSAVQNIAPQGADGAINYASAVYLMVIRFYGYDLDGKIVNVAELSDQTNTSDASAVVEKFIPFRIRYINWSVTNQLVTYEFDTAPIGHMIGYGTRRATIPKDIEISGATVSEMLGGDIVYSGQTGSPDTPGASTTATTQTRGGDEDTQARTSPGTTPAAPAKASSARNNKGTVKQGLMQALNLEQQRLVATGIQEYADIYEIEFANGAEFIRDATVTKPGAKVNKAATPMANGQRDTSVRSPDKNSQDTTARNFGVVAGQQITQVIDLIIRNSNYITEQAAVVINEFTGELEPNPRVNTGDGVSWFNITVQATPLKDQYDRLRRDDAYRIRYIIVPYDVVDFDSAYFPPGRFRGLHKRYPWWFTGENISVLDYKATFNKLYALTVSGSDTKASFLNQQRQRQTSSMREIAFHQYAPRSTESDSGAAGKANELAANAAEYLYNTSDNANAQVRIIGDPAWIQQGSQAGGVDPKNLSYRPFNADGTINFDTNDVMFEIVWQKPEDYDQGTGVADPFARTKKTFGDRQPIQSAVYRARRVVSEFRSGRFEQVIEGTLYNYPVPDSANQASGAGSAAGSVNAPGVGTQSEGNAGEAEARLNLERINSGRLAATAPQSPALGSGLSTAGFNVNNLGVPAASGLIESARLQNAAGGLGLRVPNPTPQINFGTASGEFVPPALAAADTLQSALPARSATTNGISVGPTAADLAEAQRIQQESGVEDAITPEQVARNRQLNQTLTGLLPIPRLPNPGVQTQTQGTQQISREA
jgi:hypothetical protein